MKPIVRLSALAVLAIACAAAARAQPPGDAAAKAAVTFDDVMSLIKAGKMPGDILESCDVVFTLTPAQRAELAKAGAPPSLVDALQRKRIAVHDVTDFVIILDCSGSMKDEIAAGRTKMDAAKKTVNDLFAAIPNGRNVAFIVYGHDASLKCQAVKVIQPLGPFNEEARKSLPAQVAALKPVGHTPIANALKAAGGELAKTEGMSQIVLITDGVETCHGDPAAEAEKLTQKFQKLRAVEVVGIGLQTKEEKDGVALIAKRGRAKFYDTGTEKGLREAIAKAAAAPIADKPVAGAKPMDVPIPADLPARVKDLLESLKSTDPDERRLAADGLGRIGNKSEVVLKALAARVADETWVKWPERWPADDPPANDSSNSKYKQWGSKYHALKALNQLAPDQVALALALALKAQKVEVRYWAALELAGRKSDDASKALVAALSDREGTVRRAAADSLAKNGDKSDAVIAALIKRVSDDRWDASPQGTFHYDPEHPPAYDDKNDWGSKHHALLALKKLAPDRVEEALLAARKSKTPAIKNWALKALNQLDTK